jgi:DNA-directed RNA polymerase II subunit RPB1
MNLTCTRPYNADFDGDEMNLHVPQTLPAVVEARELMAVHKLMISPQANRPVMGVVQDALVGAYLMSQESVVLSRQEVMAVGTVCNIGWAEALPEPAIMIPHNSCRGRYTPMWTGKQALSIALPNQLNFGGRVVGLSPSDGASTPVIIVQGELLCGHLDKKTLGTSEGSVVHVLMNDASPEVARDCLDKVTMRGAV